MLNDDGELADPHSLLERTDGHAIIISSLTRVDLDIKVNDTAAGELETIAQHILIAAGHSPEKIAAVMVLLNDSL